jgi:hypothetical protein
MLLEQIAKLREQIDEEGKAVYSGSTSAPKGMQQQGGRPYRGNLGNEHEQNGEIHVKVGQKVFGLIQ